MKFTVKFIVAQSYDFTDKEGRRVAGCSVHCFDQQTKNFIKCKLVNSAAIEGKKFGDDITVTCIPNGRFLRYEV